MRPGRVSLCALATGFLLLVACSDEAGGPGVYEARGIVEDVDVTGAQVLIDHEDVPGLMPAMTMNFAVPDEEVRAVLAGHPAIRVAAAGVALGTFGRGTRRPRNADSPLAPKDGPRACSRQ